MKNHKQIWTHIARAFYTHERARLTGTGLCFAYLMMVGEVSGQIFYTWASRDPDLLCFWLPPHSMSNWLPEHDLLRGDMAVLFSLMTETEFNELIRSK